ncbi:MAG TPA: MerR family transcriptional regulator [Fibrobacteraceae bacterium]|nr:MerR family transcriptional regulator [Fibrobacteraceae bacterium]
MRYGEGKEEKLYHPISEVAELTGVPAHILRYWEQEIPMLRPRKNRAGNRVYRERDIELVRRIRELVQGQGYTLDGACRVLKTQPIQSETPSTLPISESTKTSDVPSRSAESRQALLDELREIRNLLR